MASAAGSSLPAPTNHSSWKVGALVGFRTRERIGVKVGGELFYVWFQRNRNPDGGRSLDAGLLFTVALLRSAAAHAAANRRFT